MATYNKNNKTFLQADYRPSFKGFDWFTGSVSETKFLCIFTFHNKNTQIKVQVSRIGSTDY